MRARRGSHRGGGIRAVLLLGVAALVAASSTAHGLTVTRNFGGGAAPGNAQGGGTLQGVFDAAADWWEMAIGTNHTVTLTYGWGPLPFGILGGHSLVSQGGSPSRETAGTITLDNDGSSLFFIDPTPRGNEEWTTYTTTSANLGGGLLNVGRVFTGATGLASGRFDLFSILLHEIGHSLGLSSANVQYQGESWPDNDVDVVNPRPYAGTVIPTNNSAIPATIATSNAHLTTPTALMVPAAGASVRKYGSALDILAMAELSDFDVRDFQPVFIPEPGTLALLGLGLLALGLGVVRRRSLPRR